MAKEEVHVRDQPVQKSKRSSEPSDLGLALCHITL